MVHTVNARPWKVKIENITAYNRIFCVRQIIFTFIFTPKSRKKHHITGFTELCNAISWVSWVVHRVKDFNGVSHSHGYSRRSGTELEKTSHELKTANVSDYNCRFVLRQSSGPQSFDPANVISSSRVCNTSPYVNPLKPRGNYMYHLLYRSVTLHFVFVGFVWFSA
jgi:hypothetical protein